VIARGDNNSGIKIQKPQKPFDDHCYNQCQQVDDHIITYKNYIRDPWPQLYLYTLYTYIKIYVSNGLTRALKILCCNHFYWQIVLL